MSREQFESFQQPEQTSSQPELNLEEMERRLTEEMQLFRLDYVARIADGKIPPLYPLAEDVDAPSFQKILNTYAGIDYRVGEAYSRRTKKGARDNPEAATALADVLSSIEEAHTADSIRWIDRVPQIISERIEQFPEGEPSEQIPEWREKKNALGILKYDIVPGESVLLEDAEKVRSFGITSEDTRLDLHLDAMALQRGSSTETGQEADLSPVRSFQKVASFIVDEHPEIRAITGTSWLLDSAVGKRYGYHVYDHTERYDTTFWGQFVGQDGKLNHERMQQLLETGEPPYRVAAGIIPVEEFLHRYLPAEKRGTVTLKRAKEGFEDEVSNESGAALFLFFGEHTYTESEITEHLQHLKLLKGYLATEKGTELLEFIFATRREKGITPEEMQARLIVSGKAEEYREYLESIKQESYTVEI